MKLSTRKIMDLCLTTTFVYLSAVGKIPVNQVIPILGIIVGFYFGKSTALDVPRVNINNKDGVENE